MIWIKNYSTVIHGGLSKCSNEKEPSCLCQACCTSNSFLTAIISLSFWHSQWNRMTFSLFYHILLSTSCSLSTHWILVFPGCGKSKCCSKRLQLVWIGISRTGRVVSCRCMLWCGVFQYKQSREILLMFSPVTLDKKAKRSATDRAEPCQVGMCSSI